MRCTFHPLPGGPTVLNRFAVAVAVVLGYAAAGVASDNTWTNAAADLTWNTTSADWTAPTVWTNGNVDSAIFGATGAGTLTVAAPITLRGMSFTANGFTLNGTAANPLTLTSGGGGSLGVGEVRVASGITATVNAIFAGTVGLSKTGAGTLTLSGANTYTGGTAVSNGVLAVSADNNLGAAASGLNLSGAGTLRVTGTAFTTSARNISLGIGGGVVDVNAAANTLTLSGLLSAVGGGLTKVGPGTLVLTNSGNTYTGTAFNAGTLSASADAQLGPAAGNTWFFTGGTLQVTGTSFTSTQKAIAWQTGGGFDIAAAANTFTVSQALGSTGPLTKLGAGTLTLSGPTPTPAAPRSAPAC